MMGGAYEGISDEDLKKDLDAKKKILRDSFSDEMTLISETNRQLKTEYEDAVTAIEAELEARADQMALERISEKKEEVGQLREKYKEQAKSRKGKMIKRSSVGALVTAAATVGAIVTGKIGVPGGATIPIILGVVGGLAAILSIINILRLHAKRRGDLDTVEKCDAVLNMEGTTPQEKATAARALLKELSKSYDVKSATEEAARDNPNDAAAIQNIAVAAGSAGGSEPDAAFLTADF